MILRHATPNTGESATNKVLNIVIMAPEMAIIEIMVRLQALADGAQGFSLIHLREAKGVRHSKKNMSCPNVKKEDHLP